MKTLTTFIKENINEVFRINKDTKLKHHKYFPKDKKELQELIENLLDERGPDANLNDIDISKVEDLSYLFTLMVMKPGGALKIRNIDISNWDVSHIKLFGFMFYNCTYFNCDLSSWDVSNAKSLQFMFKNCRLFDASCTKNWNPPSTAKMKGMFNSIPGCEPKNIPDKFKEYTTI